MKNFKFICAAAAAALFLPQQASAALVALYQFDDQANLGWDSSGAGNHAQNFGAEFSVLGFQGGAASFSITDWMQAPLDLSAASSPRMTWGAWVRPATGGAAIQAVLSNDDGGFDRQIGIDSRNGNAAWGAFTGSNVLNTGLAPSTSDWTFLAAVYDQSLASVTYYVNGQVFTASASFGASPSNFAIGKNLTFDSHFSGAIDNVFVYDDALNATQIDQLRATGFPNAQAPVAAVPEPGTWAMMLIGFGAIGGAMRRKRSNVIPQIA